MNGLMKSLRSENGSSLRGLTGQGEPGLYTLLGGTERQSDASAYTMSGGAGQVGAISERLEAYKDTRLRHGSNAAKASAERSWRYRRNPFDFSGA